MIRSSSPAAVVMNLAGGVPLGLPPLLQVLLTLLALPVLLPVAPPVNFPLRPAIDLLRSEHRLHMTDHHRTVMGW